MKKKIFGFVGGASALLMAVATLPSIAGGKLLNLKADNTCDHVGYHYDEIESTCAEQGRKEFWTCCVCHQSWLSNPGGTFTEGTDFKLNHVDGIKFGDECSDHNDRSVQIEVGIDDCNNGFWICWYTAQNAET